VVGGGGFGFLYKPSGEVGGDDDDKITSYIVLGPARPAGDLREVTLTGLRFYLSGGTNLNYQVLADPGWTFAGNGANDNTRSLTGLITAFSEANRRTLRLRGGTFTVKLSDEGTSVANKWSFELLDLLFGPAGTQRVVTKRG
jgi:hypothetical protein